MDTAHFGILAQELIEDAPCGIAVSDPDGRLIYGNLTVRRWLALQPGATLASIGDLLTVPGRIYMQTHVMPMLRLQGFAREIAVHLRAAEGGTPRPVLLNAVMRHAPDGSPCRIDYTIFDATERSQYEESLRQARLKAEELAAIVRTSPNAILRVAADGRVLSWNRGAERQFGVPAAAAEGRPVQDLVALAEAPAWICDGGLVAGNFEEQHEGDRTYSVAIAPIGQEADGGDGRGDFSVVFRDITEQRRAERDLRLVVRELDHRVKNILAVVNAIARQTLPADEHRPFTARLRALTRAHESLTRAQEKRVDLHALLDMIRDEAGGPARLGFEGPPVPLLPRHYTLLSMVFHELVTNALKYGALSVSGGKVTVRYALSDAPDPTLTLDWAETGGPAAQEPRADGFGSQMTRAVVSSEFDGTFERWFEPTGMRCRLVLMLGAGD